MIHKFTLKHTDTSEDVLKKIKECLSKFNMDIYEIEYPDRSVKHESVTYEINDHGNR